MNGNKYRLLVTWNVVLTTLLIVALAFIAMTVQASNDPPVQVYTATLDHGVATAGTGTTSDKTISGTAYQDILSIDVDFTGQTHTHQCLAIGSANVKNPASSVTGKRYDFSIKQDAGVSTFAQMTLEFSDNASVDDPNWVPVTTQRLLTNISAGPHTLSFVAREQNAGNPNLVIDNASFTVICIKRVQTLENAEPEAPAGISNEPNDK